MSDLETYWSQAKPIEIVSSFNPTTGKVMQELVGEAPDWVIVDYIIIPPAACYFNNSGRELVFDFDNGKYVYTVEDKRYDGGSTQVLGHLKSKPAVIVIKEPTGELSWVERLKNALRPKTLSMKLF